MMQRKSVGFEFTGTAEAIGRVKSLATASGALVQDGEEAAEIFRFTGIDGAGAPSG